MGKQASRLGISRPQRLLQPDPVDPGVHTLPLLMTESQETCRQRHSSHITMPAAIAALSDSARPPHGNGQPPGTGRRRFGAEAPPLVADQAHRPGGKSRRRQILAPLGHASKAAHPPASQYLRRMGQIPGGEQRQAEHPAHAAPEHLGVVGIAAAVGEQQGGQAQRLRRADDRPQIGGVLDILQRQIAGMWFYCIQPRAVVKHSAHAQHPLRGSGVGGVFHQRLRNLKAALRRRSYPAPNRNGRFPPPAWYTETP